ncbi:hypothetical protein Dimus_038318 [Dionaea muscipula]
MVQKKERCEKLQSDPFIRRLPAAIRDYISSIGNVKGDGHCEFRAIVAQIGYGEAGWDQVRRDLMDEIVKNQHLYDEVFLTRDATGNLLFRFNYFDSPAPSQHWMKVMEMGIMIATRYNIVLHTFVPSIRGSFTHLPLWSPPIMGHDRREISIACIDSHFVQVFLKDHYPVPPNDVETSI